MERINLIGKQKAHRILDLRTARMIKLKCEYILMAKFSYLILGNFILLLMVRELIAFIQSNFGFV
jgi:hypothetical protein